MKLIHTITQMQEETRWARGERRTIGLVPTMGALHEGHLTLIRRARAECDFVVVSVFVNPTQFGPTEDFAKYPRTLEEDCRKCDSVGADAVFAPSPPEMYPEGFDTWVEVGGLTDVLEGACRPGHFRGVTTVCNKLFQIVQPARAFFGTKDYQQLQVIRKMVRDLNMPLEIVPVETVREHDGLAMSSRNAYLSPDERQAALVLSRSLAKAREAAREGERSPKVIKDVVESLIRAEPMAQIDYIAVVDAETLMPIDHIDEPAAVLLAVRFGSTRLIDNTVVT